MLNVTAIKHRVIQDPPLAHKLFNSTFGALLWLPLRIWVGYQWIEAGLHKVTNPAWVSTGEALKGFWMNAITIPDAGRPAIAFNWYRDFVQFLLNTGSYTWFGKLVAFGELAVGIALVLGAFTGIAAFFGAFMNWNYMMAGSASTNPLLFVAAIALILAWKVAGYLGLDFFLLDLLGVPWKTEEEYQQLVSVERQHSPAK
jgi:thiosulfate dehydrogenase [quinone] large subunit